jgi:hypothetical protein
METLPCSHRFCAGCIGEWRKSGAGDDRTCPLCRAENALHCIYVPTEDASRVGKQGSLLSAKLEQHFAQQLPTPIVFCNSQRVRFSTFMVPESLLDTFDAYCATALNGQTVDRVAGRPQSLRAAAPSTAAAQHNEKECQEKNVWHLTLCASSASVDSSSSSSAGSNCRPDADVVGANDPLVQRVTRDPRFVCLASSNARLRRNGMLHLHCRIEQQAALGLSESDCLKPPEDEQRQPAIEHSLLADSIDQMDGRMDPVMLQMRYGEQMDAMAARLPNSEVERLRTSHHLDLSRSDSGGGDGAVTERLDDRQARFMIVYNRLHNRICNVCWLRRDEAPLQCCAHCQMTWYCSEQCAVADWASHSRWCCRSGAPCDDGPMQMVLTQPDNAAAERARQHDISVLQAQ